MKLFTELMDEAEARGFTKRICTSTDFHNLDLMVRPDADLDGSFTAVCLDTGHTLRVNGWLHTYEVVA